MTEGTFNCPICGEDQPHAHTGDEVAQHRVSLVARNKAHWHLVNVNHATATGNSYYPAIYSGSGEELGYARGDIAQRLIDDHNRTVDELTGKSGLTQAQLIRRAVAELRALAPDLLKQEATSV